MQNEPIRVLMVIGRMDFGGAETLLMNIYRCIDRKKVQFDFLVHTGPLGAYEEEINALGGNIYRIDKYRGINYFSYTRQLKAHFSAHPEHKIVHCHMARNAMVCLNIAKKFGVYAIVHSHSTNDTKKKLYSLCRFLYSYPTRLIADHFFACSPEAANVWFGKKIANSNKCDILYNGIDCDRFAFSQSVRDEIRKALGLNNYFVVGHTGRHTTAKNPLFLIKVFAEVYKNDRNARLLQVGQGEMTEQMKEKCREMGIENAVIFAGAHMDVERYYSAMDVFLFPSLWEGLGMVAVEAQTNGLHTVVSDAVPELADIGAGTFHPVKLSQSTGEWADELLKYRGAQRVNNGREYACKAGYDVRQTAKALTSFYCQVNDK